MVLSNRIEAFRQLGEVLRSLVGESASGVLTDFAAKYADDFSDTINRQCAENKWFLPEFCRYAVSAIAKMLNGNSLALFESQYKSLVPRDCQAQTVAVISAGNIPLAAFHDFMMVLLSGNRYMGKLSAQDKLLLPFLSRILIDIAPEFADCITFVDKVAGFDKVIATGSDNTARYFAYYFGKYPHILRKNRNSLAILDGNESEDDLLKLCDDIFLYFGLGCRSVSKLYIPENYDFEPLIRCMNHRFADLKMRHAYQNNLDYQKTIYMMNRIEFLDAEVVLLTENEAIASPIGILYYQHYLDVHEIEVFCAENAEHIQCVATNLKVNFPTVCLGQTQQPTLFDFADGVDTFRFCVCN